MAPPSDNNRHGDDDVDSEPELLNAEDALEEFDDDDGDDVAMDSGDDEELLLVNDSIAYFDGHKDSVFAIAQHPVYASLVATGGGEGDDDDAPGKGYVLDTSAAVARPVLPASFSNDPEAAAAAAEQSVELQPLFELDGHTDSINTLVFTRPSGQFLVSGGLDGRMRVYSVALPSSSPSSPSTAAFAFVGEAQEVPEINWLAACPSPAYPNTVALGASDGSVWVYTIDPAADPANPLQIVQSYFLHTVSCTAGVWSPDGQLLATVSEDSSLHVWDVWGAAAAKGLTSKSNGQTVVSLTAADQRFEVEGGLYSVAISPNGSLVAVGGAGGVIKIVGLPRLADAATKPSRGPSSASAAAGQAQAGTILASLQVQSDSVEALSFAPPPLNLLAAGSVDGSVAVYDVSRSFAVRRHITAAHDEFSVVQVEWVRSPMPVTSSPVGTVPSHTAAAGGPAQWLLTSCGMDGVVRRWDLRATASSASSHAASAAGGPTPATTGLINEWRGHRGEGDGGGVLGFVQGDTGERIITAGDDGVVLVFEA